MEREIPHRKNFAEWLMWTVWRPYMLLRTVFGRGRFVVETQSHEDAK